MIRTSANPTPVSSACTSVGGSGGGTTLPTITRKARFAPSRFAKSPQFRVGTASSRPCTQIRSVEPAVHAAGAGPDHCTSSTGVLNPVVAFIPQPVPYWIAVGSVAWTKNSAPKMSLPPRFVSSIVALNVTVALSRTGFGNRRRLPLRTSGPWTSPPGRLMQNVPSDASCALNTGGGIPVSYTTMRIMYEHPFGQFATLLMSSVAVTSVPRTVASSVQEAPASRLYQISWDPRGCDLCQSTCREFVTIVSPPFGFVTCTIGGLRPMSQTIVLFRMSVRCALPGTPAMKLMPVNSKRYEATRARVPHHTQPGVDVPLSPPDSHLRPSSITGSPVFVSQTVEVSPPAAKEVPSSPAPPDRWAT